MSLEILNYNANAGFGVIFPAKCFIIEEKDQINIISPCELSEQKIKIIKDSEKRVNIISPNNLHNLHLRSMQEHFPNAQFFGPRRSAKQSGVNLEKITDLKTHDLEIIPIKGNKSLGESCFFHRPSQTLIVTDLFFNMREDVNFMLKLALKMAGAYNKLATSRLIKFTINNQEQFNLSLEKLISVKPEKIIPSHGEEISFEQFKKLVEGHLKKSL